MTLCVENNPSLDYAYQEDGLTWGMLNPAGITGQINYLLAIPSRLCHRKELLILTKVSQVKIHKRDLT